jgi:hypothetical protein
MERQSQDLRGIITARRAVDVDLEIANFIYCYHTNLDLSMRGSGGRSLGWHACTPPGGLGGSRRCDCRRRGACERGRGSRDIEHGRSGTLGEAGCQRGAEPVRVLDSDAPASVPGRRRCQNALWRRLPEGGGERRCPRIRIWGFLGAETVQSSFHGVRLLAGVDPFGFRWPRTENPSSK